MPSSEGRWNLGRVRRFKGFFRARKTKRDVLFLQNDPSLLIDERLSGVRAAKLRSDVVRQDRGCGRKPVE